MHVFLLKGQTEEKTYVCTCVGEGEKEMEWSVHSSKGERHKLDVVSLSTTLTLKGKCNASITSTAESLSSKEVVRLVNCLVQLMD
jgi:hypothetical protein